MDVFEPDTVGVGAVLLFWRQLLRLSGLLTVGDSSTNDGTGAKQDGSCNKIISVAIAVIVARHML